MNTIETLGFDPKQFMDELVAKGLASRSTTKTGKRMGKRPMHTTRDTLPVVGTKDADGYECIGCQRVIVDGEERWIERWLSSKAMAKWKKRNLHE
jgi:hypothetical protein